MEHSKRKRTKKRKLNKHDNACGVAGNYRKKDNSEDGIEGAVITNNDTGLTKLDRHGFVVSHQMHDQVCSAIARVPVAGDVFIRHESKWLQMIDNWDDVVKDKDNKIKKRCRKGIPQSVRSLAWQHLTSAKKLRDQSPDLYENLIQQTGIDESEWSYVIRKDIPRTFRHHSMFYENNSRGQEDLYNVLLAYSTYDVETGYNQALAPIAAVLLMHMPPCEAFWILVSICKYYLPGYYGKTMEGVKLDGLIFSHLLEVEVPHVANHMNANGIEPMLYLVEWMICIFSRSLPFDTVLRIWDMFFCEGFKVLFKVALSIMRLVFPTTKGLEGIDDYETSQVLSKLPKHCVEEEVLLCEILNSELTYKNLRKVHKKVLVNNPELTITRYTGGFHMLSL